jgi:hypothetical protein
MFQLKFYATRSGHYFNKFFCFNFKDESEIGNILLPFALNDNQFYSIYVYNRCDGSQYKLNMFIATELVKQAALMKGVETTVK